MSVVDCLTRRDSGASVSWLCSGRVRDREILVSNVENCFIMRLSPAVQTLKPSATLAAAAKAKALKTQGINVYDFTLGEPDFNTPEHIQEAAIAAMRAGHTHYTPSAGILELKKAIG
ncbi:MAG: Aspartate aminotransferase, partial [Planctomycetaceae bacterium]|nr:Aspartate aminotransferase [Planctomycetaceae bacterium]